MNARTISFSSNSKLKIFLNLQVKEGQAILSQV